MAFLPIDRAFSIVGHGPVVTGTLRGAAISAGDALELLPLRRTVRVRAVQVHGARVTAAMPGERVALNLRDIEIGELKRGMALTAPDTLALSDWLTISIRAVEGAPPLKNGMRVRALFGTDESDARLRLLDRNVLEPGQSGFAQLHCALRRSRFRPASMWYSDLRPRHRRSPAAGFWSRERGASSAIALEF